MTAYFSPQTASLAAELYQQVAQLPLICPHGHVDPRLFADEHYDWGTPVDLLLIPDHYIFRMLYSQGITLESLGIPRRDGGQVATDHRQIWQVFAEHFYLFRGTPTGIWIRDELSQVFEVTEKLNGHTAQAIYDQIASVLQQIRPRQLFEQFNIEVMATTDAATDPLPHHQTIRQSGWQGRIIPTFRPDSVVNIDYPEWRSSIDDLSTVTGIDIHDMASYLVALQNRRAYFKELGATATDHAALTAYTEFLSPQEADAIFNRALAGTANAEDAKRFTGHMFIQLAQMSLDDGLTMQLHIGSYRDHNPDIVKRFGRNMGADIPTTSEFTRNLKPLLDRVGNQSELTLILFNLDESTYSRELAPLAGHYPALKLGPPWWFFDSLNGMIRFLDSVVETAGIYNTAGFNDDTRAFPSIPARHQVWRQACADWLAGLVARHIIDREDANAMIYALAYDLAKQAYRLDY